MTHRARVLVACLTAFFALGAASAPAFAENESAHRMTKTMRRHPMHHHHHNALMRRNMR